MKQAFEALTTIASPCRRGERAPTTLSPQGSAGAGGFPPGEPVDAASPRPVLPARVNVIAAAGSQIHPDRHGVALYYLINIGSIIFRHGLAEAPVVACQPEDLLA